MNTSDIVSILDDEFRVRETADPDMVKHALTDHGRSFVVNYTDDTAAACKANPGMFGVPWIRGTYVNEADLPPIRS